MSTPNLAVNAIVVTLEMFKAMNVKPPTEMTLPAETFDLLLKGIEVIKEYDDSLPIIILGVAGPLTVFSYWGVTFRRGD